MSGAAPARAAAFDILMRVERDRAYASELLHTPAVDKLSPQDRGLCTEIVMGVLRWQPRLDESVAGLVSRPLAKIDLEVLIALRMGAYQAAFLSRIPKHAIVNDAVELVKRAKKTSAAGMVNAVLRKLPANKRAEASDVAWRAELVKDAQREPDRAAAALAHATAHPQWLVERWMARFGAERAVAICAHDQRAPETAVRLRDGTAKDELAREGVQLAPGALLASAWRVVAGDVTKTGAFREGHVAVQDEASQLVALLVGRGPRILDCCAAPGGKTSILAERNPDSKIVAAELHQRRAELLRKRVAANVEVRAADATALAGESDFERVLADVPCSGTGTLARNPEIKWRLKPEDLEDLHRRQVAILRAAVRHTTAGGRVVYATCSLEREEDEAVIEEVVRDVGVRVIEAGEELERLAREGELVWRGESLVSGSFVQTIPGVHPCDGFFAAVLERVGG